MCLCAKAVQILPRELRDQIYSYLRDRRTMESIDYAVLHAARWNRQRSDFIPDFVNPIYVDVVLAKEAFEWAYEDLDLTDMEWARKRSFKKSLDKRCSGKTNEEDTDEDHVSPFKFYGIPVAGIKSYLETDVFCVGVEPKNISICELTTAIDFEPNNTAE